MAQKKKNVGVKTPIIGEDNGALKDYQEKFFKAQDAIEDHKDDNMVENQTAVGRFFNAVDRQVEDGVSEIGWKDNVLTLPPKPVKRYKTDDEKAADDSIKKFGASYEEIPKLGRTGGRPRTREKLYINFDSSEIKRNDKETVQKEPSEFDVTWSGREVDVENKYNKDLVAQLESELDVRNGNSGEATTRLRLQKIFDFPWGVKTVEETDLEKVRSIIDGSHTGLAKVKDAIINALAGRIKNPTKGPQPILLIGPPGVGKTSFVDAINVALNRKYARINLNQVNETHDLVGSSNLFSNSSSGAFLNAMIEAGSVNPVILLDEIDKVRSNGDKNPIPAFLDILDRQQNFHWKDKFTEAKYNLSNVLWIATANYIGSVPAEILSRFEVIEIDPYTIKEKVEIAKKHIFEQMLTYFPSGERNGLSDDSIVYLITRFTEEGGVRQFYRLVEKLDNWLHVNGKQNNILTSSQLNRNVFDLALGGWENNVVYPPEYGKVSTIIATQNGPVLARVEAVAIKDFARKNVKTTCETSPHANAFASLQTDIAFTAFTRFVLEHKIMTPEEFYNHSFGVNVILPNATIMGLEGLSFAILNALYSSLKLVLFENEIVVGKIDITGRLIDFKDASKLIKGLYSNERNVIYTSSQYLNKEDVKERFEIEYVNYTEDILSHKAKKSLSRLS